MLVLDPRKFCFCRICQQHFRDWDQFVDHIFYQKKHGRQLQQNPPNLEPDVEPPVEAPEPEREPEPGEFLRVLDEEPEPDPLEGPLEGALLQWGLASLQGALNLWLAN